MPDAHKGHGSWTEPLDSPPEPEGARETASTHRGDNSRASEAANWRAHLDSSPATPTTPSPPRPGADSARQPQAVSDPRVTELQRRWLFTQAQLLDDPSEAMLEAGRLIDDAMRLVAGISDQQRTRIERKWQTAAGVDTDELRSIMQRHRSLFQYVLAAEALVAELGSVRREHRTAANPQPRDTAPQPAAAAPEGPAEVLQRSRAARYEAEASDPYESSRATQVRTGFGASWKRIRRTRWVAGTALLLLVGLAAAYGWWKWQQSDRGVSSRQARALTVERLLYVRHDQRSPAPDQQATDVPDSRAAEGTEEVTGSPVTAQAALIAPAAREHPTTARTDRGPVPPTPEGRRALPAAVTARLTDEVTPQPAPAMLQTEAAFQVPTQQTSSTQLQSKDRSQILPATAVPTPIATESRPPVPLPGTATATAENEPPSVPQTSLSARDPEPVLQAPGSAVRRGDLVELSDPGVARPELVVAPRADYPFAAQRLRRETTVELRVLVDERGMPSRIEPAGRRAGLGFDEAARVAVEHARWQPATKDGVPVKVWLRTEVRFELEGR